MAIAASRLRPVGEQLGLFSTAAWDRVNEWDKAIRRLPPSRRHRAVRASPGHRGREGRPPLCGLRCSASLPRCC